ncbi:hypothetical protein [Pseudolactococcus reticulitermitis]|uniref:Uncharacterized protein n=1 Tax=Pseudolactococcus reticulitermitis TaxID=2025039 RepID=A0A224X5I7_9LACT|nr:hypothetical protein [Lactococcus reticulitermitis]GAX46800.1 hypothetical protein RsY01_380 [Lactococcus reticulitermitis]
MIEYKILKLADYENLQNELVRKAMLIASLEKEIEQLTIVRNNQFQKIDELNQKLSGYQEDRMPLDKYPLIYRPKRLSMSAVNTIIDAENSGEVINYLKKELE